VRICVIGKFPPIQGGVSMRTYWTAHALARRGHDVHVVTNAKEVRPPFRMHMRPQDWMRCEAKYGPGSVTLHWTDPVDSSQRYIPMASPFVSKLAATAARVYSDHPYDVIFSHYMEPYGIAGHLAAQMVKVPHVVRMAGSDAGRLWHHPQFEALYDHVLRSAEALVVGGAVADRAAQRGVDPNRIVFGDGFVVPEDLFTPGGPSLDLTKLQAEVRSSPDLRDLLWGEFAGDRPYFGICGKLGENKGSFALLAAMRRLKQAGLEVGLVALAHGPPAIERRFRRKARELGVADRILQIPFLPHWRVPEFLRSCMAVCCLEQDFPIEFHTPIIPREVLLCGTCLIASAEVVRKFPAYGRLPNAYGCVAVENVNDVETLSRRLADIVQDPEPLATVGARGRRFACELQQDISFPQTLEHILTVAAARQPLPSSMGGPTVQASNCCFPLTQTAVAELAKIRGKQNDASTFSDPVIDLDRAHEVLSALEREIGDGKANLRPLVPAIRIEIAIATVESEVEVHSSENFDPIFQLRIERWAMDDGDLPGLRPVADPNLRILKFEYDISTFRGVRAATDLREVPALVPSYLVAFRQSGSGQRAPLQIDHVTAQILDLCDGTRTALEIVGQLDQQATRPEESIDLKWIERLFAIGLISLRETPINSTNGPGSDQHSRPPSNDHPRSAEKVQPPV
jgi:glycosyltransferase involved in cell wall biosynthesis